MPADTISARFAAEIASVDKVDFNCAQSASKIPAGEQFVQSFYTMALMHGGIGTRGAFSLRLVGRVKEFMSSGISTGAYCPVTADPANPFGSCGLAGVHVLSHPVLPDAGRP